MQETIHSNLNSFSANDLKVQQAFLLKLSDAMRPLDNPVDIEEAVTKIALDFMDADWCHYSTIVEDKLVILRDAVRGDLPSLVGEYKISSFALFKAVLDSGHPFIIDDVHTTIILDEELKQLCGQLQNIAFIIVPVIKNGKPKGMLTLVQSKPRKWTDFEVQLTIETAERTWTAVERAKAEEALRKSEEKYRTLFTSIDQGFVICELVRDKEGKGIDYYMLELNPTYETQTGLSAEMVLGKTILQVFPTIDKSHIDTFAAVVDNQRPVIFEQYFEVNHRWHEVKVYPGEKDRFTVLFSDISERKKAGEKIEESKTQLQNIFLNAPAAIAIFEGPQHKYILANKAYEKLSNRKAADLLGKSMEVLFPELKGTGTLELFDKVLETGESFSAPEYALMLDLKNEGVLRQYYFNFSMEPLKNDSGEIYAVLAVTYDITEQVESRKRIEESESRFRLMANAIPEVMWVADAQGKPEFFNKRWEEFSGVAFKASTVEEVAAAFLHPDDIPAVLAAFSEAIKTGNVMEVEQRNRSASGEYRWFLNRAAPYRNPQTGEIEKWFGIGTDIDERKKTEKALAESESRFRAVLEQAPLAIVITGVRGEIQFHNTMFEELWGRPAQETEMSTYSQVYSGFHLDGTALKSEEWPAAKAIMNGEVVIDEILEIAHLSGRKIPCSFNAGPIHNEDGSITGAVVLFRDVTAERTASMQLQESEEKYRTLFNSIHDAFCIIEMIFDKKGVPIDWIYEETNLAFSLHATVEMKGKRISETVPEMETFWLEKYGTVAKTGDPVQLEHVVKGLGDQWFQTSAFRHGPEGSNKVAVLFRNITERKQADEKLKESESRFRTMADASPVLIWTIDASGLSSYYNKTFLDFIGASQNEDISDWAKIVHPEDVQLAFDTINTAIAERRSYSLELRLLRADGQWRWVLAQGNPNVDTNNEFLGFVGSSVDITERKEAEEKITESEKRFSNLLLESPFAFAILKGKDMVVYLANDTIKNVWGKGSDVEGKSLMTILPEIEEQGFAALLEQVYTTGKPFYGHEVLVKLERNGIWEDIYFNFIYQPYKEADETISGITIIANEVTTQAIANKKILAAKDNVSRLFMQAPAVICVLRGPQHVFELTNDKYLQLVGKREMLGMTVREALPEVEGQGFFELLDNVYATGEPFIGNEMPVQIKQENGKLEDVYFNFVYQASHNSEGEIDGILVHAVDVSEQVCARKKIEEREQYFRQLTDTVPAIIWITEPDGSCSYLNNNWYSYTGQTEAEALGFGWLNATHPDDKEETEKIFLKAIANHKPFLASYRLKVKNGDYRWAIDRGSPKFGEDGHYEGMIGTVVDVHEEKLAADKIHDSEKQFNTLANNIQNLAWIADGNGWTYWYNQRWYDYTGTTLEEMKGWGWKKVHHPEHVTRVVDFKKQAWNINKPFELIFPLRGSDGLYRTFLTRAYPVSDRDGKIINWIGTNTDIEEQKIEEQKKDEFISIASHEMKTPLTTAKAYLQMLELSLDDTNDEANLYAKKASQSVNRLNELIVELLDVSKISLGKLNYTVTTFNFNDMVDSTVENLQITSPTHIIIKRGKVNDKVTGDKERLQQVVINLLTNAVKYSPGAEKVYITVEQENELIKVSVKDSGIGMSRESLKKIFDKYHRIEEHALHFQGLGIGLFISYEIIQRHHGNLWAESEQGNGSTFYFSIPLKHVVPVQ